MNDVNRSLAAETETLRAAYAALNRGDVSAMVALFDPQIEYSEPAGFPGAGTYRGRGELERHVTKMRGQWAEGTCEPERFIMAGDKIVVFAQVHVRFENHTDWIDGPVTDVYTFRGGTAVHWRTFADREQALEWAGVNRSAL